MNSDKPNFNLERPSRRVDEPFESEKDKVWKMQRAEVEKMTDRLAMAIDEEIKELITALRVYEFPTYQSCAGHRVDEENDAISFPWVVISVPEPKGLDESEGLERESKDREWATANLRLQQRMMGYFEGFYRNRSVPFDARLIFDRLGFGFRIQSIGANTMELLPPEDQMRKLELYQKEMNDFGQFLKDRYFSEQNRANQDL